jgi:hypothetical protein
LAENRVPESASDRPLCIEHRQQHEGPAMKLRVRNGECAPVPPMDGPASDTRAVQDKVEIENARAPMSSKTPAMDPFDPLQETQEHSGRRAAIEHGDGIEVGRLVTGAEGRRQKER